MLKPDTEQVMQVYRKRARNYDFSTWFYNLIGFRINYYRRFMVDALELKEGDTVVDLCCGTGLNFPLLRDYVGESGKIIGVDLSQDMLKQAEKRILDNNWSNIELVVSDATSYQFPKGLNGLVSSYAITLVPKYDIAIKNGSGALDKGARFAILDFKIPDWPMWLIKIAEKTLVRPYAGTLDMAMERNPRKSIQNNLNETSYKEFYFGSVYLTVGEK